MSVNDGMWMVRRGPTELTASTAQAAAAEGGAGRRSMRMEWLPIHADVTSERGIGAAEDDGRMA